MESPDKVDSSTNIRRRCVMKLQTISSLACAAYEQDDTSQLNKLTLAGICVLMASNMSGTNNGAYSNRLIQMANKLTFS